MSDSQLNQHQIRVLSANRYDHHPDQKFAATLMRILLSSGSRLRCIERFMDMMSHNFPELQMCLFSAHSESRLSLLCARPELTELASERFFPVLSTESCCIISHLNDFDTWNNSYAELFPAAAQCLLFSASINTRHYTLMVMSSAEDIELEPWFQKFCYTCDLIRIISEYMTFVESHFEQVEYIQQREKFASLGQLAAGVAHEINNPLAFIMSNFNTLNTYFSQLKSMIGQSGMVLDEAAEFLLEDSDAILSETYEGLTRIQSIVTSLNVYEHESSGAPRQIDLRDVISTALSMISGEIRLKAEVNYQIPDEPFYVSGYPARLQQVIIHLIVNALQSVQHDHGKIGLVLSVDNAEKNPAKKIVSLTIEDNGRGIPQENLKRIFDPFFTTKRVGDGVGLGLSVAKEIIEEHHGHISVESEEMRGTKVLIQLPGQVCFTDKYDAF